MSTALFQYPAQAGFHRVVPKTKIFTHARPTRSLRDRFAREVAQIVWEYKLAPETVNLPNRPAVPEIQVFTLHLKPGAVDEVDEGLLRCIDKAIHFPIFFEVLAGERIRLMAAYKRPSEADAAKWVVGDYFTTPWLPLPVERSPLPVALDLATLYEQMLRRLIPTPARETESLQAVVERHAAIRSKQASAAKLAARLQREDQFNRKVEINAQLRALQAELAALSGV
jgi:hypothetical protein